MDFVRLFQNMHDPLQPKKGNAEIEKLRKIITEKDTVIENHAQKINELQEIIKTYEESKESNERTKLNNEMYDVLIKYEKMISSMLVSYENEKQERASAQNHLACLESAFHDLIKKYERAKTVITGFQENETMLLNHIADFENDIERLKERYVEFKAYALNSINESNATIKELNDEHALKIQDMEKKLQYAEQKIRVLEKGNLKNDTNYSIFQPLVTNFK